MRQDFYNYKQKVLKSLLEQDLKGKITPLSPVQKKVLAKKPSVVTRPVEKPVIAMQTGEPQSIYEIIEKYSDILTEPPFYINNPQDLGPLIFGLPYEVRPFIMEFLMRAIRIFEEFGDRLDKPYAKRKTSTGPITVFGEARQEFLLCMRIIKGLLIDDYGQIQQGIRDYLKQMENKFEYAVLITGGTEEEYRQGSSDFYRYVILNMLFDNDPSDNPGLEELMKRLNREKGIRFGDANNPFSILSDNILNYLNAEKELQQLLDVIEGQEIEYQENQIQDLIDRLNDMGPDYVDIANLIQQAYENLSNFAAQFNQLYQIIKNYSERDTLFTNPPQVAVVNPTTGETEYVPSNTMFQDILTLFKFIKYFVDNRGFY